VSANPVIRILRGCAAFLANALAALIGVGILKSLSSMLVKLFTHSRASIILTEWIGSIVFAALLGNSVQRRWRTRTARWIWIPAVLVFLFNLAEGYGFPSGNFWLTFSGIACAQRQRFACIQFTVFTVALVRTLTYSLAAFLSARFGTQQSADFHPVLSHLLSGLFLVGLPKSDIRESPQETTAKK